MCKHTFGKWHYSAGWGDESFIRTCTKCGDTQEGAQMSIILPEGADRRFDPKTVAKIKKLASTWDDVVYR